jgi:ADP-ribose pyrophosphatase YjhB (NUDIX family)
VGVALVLWRGPEKTHMLLGKGHSRADEPIFALPGGHWDPGERLADAVRRELAEEAGVSCGPLGLVSVYDFVNRERQRQYVALGFEAVLDQGAPQVLEPDKKADWGWYSPQAALSFPLFEPDRVLISRVISRVQFTEE